jgi:signal transduction histidine kinase
MLVKARNLLDTIRVRIRIPPAFGKRGSARHDSEIRELRRLSEQQAALRRVATTLARGSSPDEVFAQVAQEVGLLLGVEMAAIHRFDPGGWSTLVGTWGRVTEVFPVGTRFALDAGIVTLAVHRTHRPVRVESYDHMPGPLAAEARRLGVRSAVGSPIVVNGRLWGALAAATFRADTTLADAEAQITEFSELVASAISNVQARSDLAASRARIVAAADDERRRVVRDLHDGAQQRLVHTIVTLKLARRAFDQGRPEAAALVGEALRHAETANDELRELAHGILPKVLTDGGLGAGVEALASRMEIPVARDVPVSRLPPPVEATAYFIVAEALTNVAKHAHAHHATVRAHLEDHTLRVEVRDDGIGGARPDGTGLVGLGDRLAALDGTLRIESPAHGGTLVAATIPIREETMTAVAPVRQTVAASRIGAAGSGQAEPGAAPLGDRRDPRTESRFSRCASSEPARAVNTTRLCVTFSSEVKIWRSNVGGPASGWTKRLSVPAGLATSWRGAANSSLPHSRWSH